MESEVGDIRGHGHIVVTHGLVDVLAVLHQHPLRPHALLSPPAGNRKTLNPTSRDQGIPKSHLKATRVNLKSHLHRALGFAACPAAVRSTGILLPAWNCHHNSDKLQVAVGQEQQGTLPTNQLCRVCANNSALAFPWFTLRLSFAPTQQKRELQERIPY